jgi:two-component system response regulator HydG
MKKKILILLGIYSLAFILGGIYIITTIESSTSTLNNLIKLYQIENQRKQLLIRIKEVQTDLHLNRTPHSKNVATIIDNVQMMERMSETCFSCHHSESVINRLLYLNNGIKEYKTMVSRVLTVRANQKRLKAEDDRTFFEAERLLEVLNTMVHQATLKLTETTQYSLNDISKSNLILFLLVSITPIFAAGLGVIFIRGFTTPAKELLSATRKLRGGSLEHRIHGLKDEFGEVAGSFNEMADQVEEYTQELERQTQEVERAHNEMSIFCQVLRQTGVQQSLDGVGTFLMRELQGILNSPYMQLLVFSTNRDFLYILSDKGVEIIQEQELLNDAEGIINGLDGILIAPENPFKPPLIPEDYPLNGRQTLIPFKVENFLEGAFVVACTEDCLCERSSLDLVSLILQQVSGSIKRAILHQEEIRSLESRIESISEFSGIIGKDPKMQVIYKLIEDIAHTDATVLIQGETGTGKEMVARAIYQESLRNEKPFVVINCSAYPATLLESELFGHEKGAFTGAVRQKAGRFEQANGGSVFLDEIGEIPLSAQIKLLRVLQTQKFERLGGEKTVSVNVRIIAATNKDLLQEVKNGNFREDLYYRLNVIPINLPTLKSRKNDIPLLARHFQLKFASEHGESPKDFSSEALRVLLDYPWPGNVRELENTIEHAVVLSKGKRIELSHLPSILISDDDLSLTADSAKTQGTIVEHEKKLLMDVLKACNWNKSQAAVQLGISRSTLYGKIKKYQVAKPTPTAD